MSIEGNIIQNKGEEMKEFTITRIDTYHSKYGGLCYLILLRSQDKTYKTWVYEKCHNFKNWKEIILLGKGTMIRNLKIKKDNLLDADSVPVIVRKEEIKENIKLPTLF